MNTQKIRIYKKIIEQVNTKNIAGKAIAVYKLPSSDIILAIDSKQAYTSWLANQSWLSVFGEGARVKKRKFAVIAYRIQVNQIQGNAIEKIYKQNPGLCRSVEILKIAFSKKLLQSG
jgi:hypothetical protein